MLRLCALGSALKESPLRTALLWILFSARPRRQTPCGPRTVGGAIVYHSALVPVRRVQKERLGARNSSRGREAPLRRHGPPERHRLLRTQLQQLRRAPEWQNIRLDRPFEPLEAQRIPGADLWMARGAFYPFLDPCTLAAPGLGMGPRLLRGYHACPLARRDAAGFRGGVRRWTARSLARLFRHLPD